jgi:hypothetical protein
MGPSWMDRIRTHFAACDPMATAVLAAVSDLVAYPLELAAWLHKLTRGDQHDRRVAVVSRCGMDLRSRLRMSRYRIEDISKLTGT